MEKIRIVFLLITILMLMAGFGSTTFAIKDPSAVYCEQLGYEFTVQEDQNGSQVGICKFSDGEVCSALAFFQGECGQNYSYCQKQGYTLKSVADPEKCDYTVVPCSFCVSQNGVEIGEVSKLMKLDLGEGKCGDGKCTMDENFEICPQDCPQYQTSAAAPSPISAHEVSFSEWLGARIREMVAMVMDILKNFFN